MAIPVILVAATVAATAISVASSVRQGQLQARAAEFNAKQAAAGNEAEARMAERRAQIAENEALAEKQAAAFDEETRRNQFSRQFAKRRAEIGASGFEFSGSPLLVAIDEAREAELDIEAMTFASETRQRGLLDEAGLERFRAEEFRKAGQTSLGIGRARASAARTEGALGAIGAGISGAASAGRTLMSPSMQSQLRSRRA